jgi:hypothetical protein
MESKSVLPSTSTALPLDPTMPRWSLCVVNADPRSAFELVQIRGFRAPTTDEAQRAWLNLVEIEYGLVMTLSSVIIDESVASKKLPAPESEPASRPNDPYANREMARVVVGEQTFSLDEYLRRQRLISDGSRAAGSILFNAGMYIYRHLAAYKELVTNTFQPQPFDKEYPLFTQFAEEYSFGNKVLDIYGVKLKHNSLLRKIAFLCPGCRRHCTTFVPSPPTAKVLHWCGAVVCEIAGPLSQFAIAALLQQPILYLQASNGGADCVNLLRGSGSTATVVQLTQCTNADESPRLWCAMMNGDLVPQGLTDVWVPSATAWRFRSMWDTEYAAEFNWPPNVRAVQWQPIKRRALGATASGSVPSEKDAARRCKQLSQHQRESLALLAIEQLAERSKKDGQLIGRVAEKIFPAMQRSESELSLLARVVFYFKCTRTRMCTSTQAAFINFIMETKSADLADIRVDDVTPAHKDLHSPCVCSRLPSFLTTHSNRVVSAVSAPAPLKTVNHMQVWRGSEFVNEATNAWQRRWGIKSKVLRTRVQDLKVHMANLNVSMTPTDAISIQDQTQGTRVLAGLMYTQLPFAPLDLLQRKRSYPTPVEVSRFVELAPCRLNDAGLAHDGTLEW